MEKTRYKAKHVVQTCFACPSQWNVYTNGPTLYVRYRYGWLSAATREDGCVGEDFFGAHVGDDLSGVMSTSEMQDFLTDCVDFSGV